MGTMLQAKGLKLGEHPELAALDHPDWLLDIHRAYAEAGSQILCANTFGANALKLAGTGYTVEQVVSAAVSIAKEAAAETGVKISLDLGPLGELLEPLTDSKFFQGFAEAFQKAADGKAADIVTHTAQALAHFVAVQIARIVIFAVAFFAVLIAWFFLSHALDLVAKLPVLSTVNAWGGGAVGLVKGALIVYIAVWLLRGSFPPATIEGSYLLKFFTSAIPLSFFL